MNLNTITQFFRLLTALNKIEHRNCVQTYCLTKKQCFSHHCNTDIFDYTFQLTIQNTWHHVHQHWSSHCNKNNSNHHISDKNTISRKEFQEHQTGYKLKINIVQVHKSRKQYRIIIPHTQKYQIKRYQIKISNIKEGCKKSVYFNMSRTYDNIVYTILRETSAISDIERSVYIAGRV